MQNNCVGRLDRCPSRSETEENGGMNVGMFENMWNLASENAQGRRRAPISEWRKVVVHFTHCLLENILF